MHISSMALTITRPDDWHLHVRDREVLPAVLPATVSRFARAIIMPNLSPPVTTVEQARAYRERILSAVPRGTDFTPLMTLYLTDDTAAGEIQRARHSGIVFGAKLYPAGATTNSDAGVTAIEKISPVLEAMERHDLPLLVHAEVTDADVDIFDRERVFIERRLSRIAHRFPELRIVFEHVTTREAVDFVAESSVRVAATITAHHLLYNRNALLAGGIHPHYYCLPVLKRERHRQALISAAVSGSPKFFLGTDSAPHPAHAKEGACGCAGCFTAHAAIELYAEAFEGADALEKLEGFASFFGADFYGLPRNRDRITLTRTAWKVPASYPLGPHRLVPLRAGEQIGWKLEQRQ